MAVMGSRGSGAFPVGSQEWDAFRKLISAAYLNPELKVRLTRSLDDNCTGCARKQDYHHVQKCGQDDDLCYEELRIEPGTVMKLWDVIQIAQDRFSIPFIKKLGTIPDKVLKNYLSFVSAPAEDDSGETKCTCPKTDCEWHGNCKKCVALHNTGNDHIPACLHPVIHDRLDALAGVIEMKTVSEK
jgi:hypothetical protein